MSKLPKDIIVRELTLPKDILKIILRELAEVHLLHNDLHLLNSNQIKLRRNWFAFLSYRVVSKEWNECVLKHMIENVYIEHLSPFVKRYPTVKNIIMPKFCGDRRGCQSFLCEDSLPPNIENLWINDGGYILASLPPLKSLRITVRNYEIEPGCNLHGIRVTRMFSVVKF